jgi:translation initiation factor IF-3
MVRLIAPDGDQLGIISRDDALKEAQERELDLVEVAPEADPPVCKLLDYGKFKYRRKKKLQGQKHHKAKLKEIRIGLNSQEHDLAFKAEQVQEFLKEHHKVMITMRLRRREKAHGDRALATMREFAERFMDVGVIEKGPIRVGADRVQMLLKPK